MNEEHKIIVPDIRPNTNPEDLGCEDNDRTPLCCEDSTSNPILVDPVDGSGGPIQ